MSRVRILLAAACVALLLALALRIVVAQGSHSASRHVTSAANPHQLQLALGQQLHRQFLSYRWIICSPTRHRYQGNQLAACNVSFGDPHIEPYCSVLIDGKLVTDHQNRALWCGARLQSEEASSGKKPL